MPEPRPLAGRILADLNVATFIKDMGLAVAEAQRALDDNSVEQTLKLGTTVLPGMTQNLLELGLQPAFYHFQYADLEMHLNVYYSLGIDVGVDMDYSSGSSSNSSSYTSDATSGTATLTVQDGDGIPPKAKVNLVRNEAGMLTLAGQGFTFDTPGASADVTVTLRDSLWETADELATELRDNAVWSDTEQTKSLDGVTVDRVPGQLTKASTNAPARYDCGRGVIVVRAATNFSGSWWLVAALASTDTAGATLGPASSSSTSVATAIGEIADHSAKTWGDPVLVVTDGEAQSPVFFAFNVRDGLVGAADNRLVEAVAAYMLGNSTTTLRLEGFADSVGTTDYNKTLSKDRAEWVKAQIVGHGVSASRIKTFGLGEVQTGDPAENRRVTFTFEGAALNGFVADTTTQPAPEWTVGTGTASLRDREKTGPDPVYTVTFGGKRFTEVASSPTTLQFAVGTTPEETAANLATAINAAFATDPRFGAFAALDRVWLHGPGDYATLTLFAHAPTAPTLSTSGSLKVASGFTGGQPPATPQPRDFIVLDDVRIVAIAAGSPAEVNSFEIGATAEETATNLAAAINAAAGDALPDTMKAQAAGDQVTVTGPAGTMVGSSNRAALSWSANRIGGKNATTRKDKSKEKMRAFNMDAHASVKYDFGVSGSSTIKARLVAIPAPPQFLNAIGEYLDRWYP